MPFNSAPVPNVGPPLLKVTSSPLLELLPMRNGFKLPVRVTACPKELCPPGPGVKVRVVAVCEPISGVGVETLSLKFALAGYDASALWVSVPGDGDVRKRCGGSLDALGQVDSDRSGAVGYCEVGDAIAVEIPDRDAAGPEEGGRLYGRR